LTNTPRLVVLISGNGSNLQAILDACSSGELDAQVVSVISNKADARLVHRRRKVEAVHFPNQPIRDYDKRLSGWQLPNYPTTSFSLVG
jgi:phosphoribosylglycinamide formyltransferase-1